MKNLKNYIAPEIISVETILQEKLMIADSFGNETFRNDNSEDYVILNG